MLHREGDSEEDTEIVGTDGLGFKVRDVLSYFYNDTCPFLVNKPKIFIFQSCRLVRSGLFSHFVDSKYNTEKYANSLCFLLHCRRSEGVVCPCSVYVLI